jgi:hypothetical protein
LYCLLLAYFRLTFYQSGGEETLVHFAKESRKLLNF